MDRAIERRVQRRLDKACGKSFIPEGKNNPRKTSGNTLLKVAAAGLAAKALGNYQAKKRWEEARMVRFNSDSSDTVPAFLNPQIESTLKTVYGNGVIRVSHATINRDGEISGIFVGRSRPSDPARTYTYGIDLVNEQVRFKRAVARRDEDNEENCCGGRKKKTGCSCRACTAKAA
jgi:hypothetical protein